MISLPRWIHAGPAWALALYSVSIAVIGTRWQTHPVTDLAALALFVVAFGVTTAVHRRTPPRWAEVSIVLVCVLMPLLATAGVDPAGGSFSSGAWFVMGVACLAIRLLSQRRILLVAIALASLVVETAVWAGPGGLVSYGVLAVVLVAGIAAVAAWAVSRTEDEMTRFHAAEREAAEWRAAQDAYHFERQVRLVRTGRLGSAMLRRIIAADGRLSEEDRAECRVLEQTIRDEIRGRRLLNDAVREQVLRHRRRGAFVQVLDDGGLDDVDEAVASVILDRVAESLVPLDSNRIVIRTAPKDSDNAVTVVATSVDPTAAALGLDDEEEVDLWLALERPSAEAAAVVARRPRLVRRRERVPVGTR